MLNTRNIKAVKLVNIFPHQTFYVPVEEIENWFGEYGAIRSPENESLGLAMVVHDNGVESYARHSWETREDGTVLRHRITYLSGTTVLLWDYKPKASPATV